MANGELETYLRSLSESRETIARQDVGGIGLLASLLRMASWIESLIRVLHCGIVEDALLLTRPFYNHRSILVWYSASSSYRRMLLCVLALCPQEIVFISLPVMLARRIILLTAIISTTMLLLIWRIDFIRVRLSRKWIFLRSRLEVFQVCTSIVWINALTTKHDAGDNAWSWEYWSK